LSGSQSKAPGFAGGYLLGTQQPNEVRPGDRFGGKTLRRRADKQGEIRAQGQCSSRRASPGPAGAGRRHRRVQFVSKKFLDHILTELRHAGLVYSKKGKGGDYALARPASDIRASARSCACSTGRLRPFPAPQSPPSAMRFLIAIRHQQIDLEKRAPIEEGRKKGSDPPRAVSRRQSDPQHAGEPVGAARRILGVLDRGERLAGAPAGPRRRPWRIFVVLVMSLTPNRASSAATAREADGCVRPNSRAALEKLPVSTVRTKRASCWSRSFIRLPHSSCTERR
jgi:hypothetical protein